MATHFCSVVIRKKKEPQKALQISEHRTNKFFILYNHIHVTDTK